MKPNINPKISIILPCQNEEQALDFCLNEIKQTIKKNRLSAEIIVSDSSTDNSPKIALRHAQGKPKITEIILIKHDKDGYGSAYLEAFKKAKGKYIFMADADATYEFNQIPVFISHLENGYDIVIGNRFGGKIEKNAMPLLNRYIGNPFLSFVFRVLFNAKIKDTQSGMRAFGKQTFEKLRLKTTGMEFASEMLIKAIKNNLKIKEIPVNYRKRKGVSKLKPYSDAWKHLRFMLLYSPLFLFFLPGLLLFLAGIFFIALGSNSLLSPFLFISGYQLIIFSIFAKTYSITHLKERSYLMEKLYKYITIEKAILAGSVVFLAGFLFTKNPIIMFSLMTMGVQTVFSSFMLSILGIKEK